MTLIAIGEGIVLGVAYKIAAVPSSVLLGVITGFMAMIPGGAPLSVTLVSVYLLASGRPIAALGLFAWGAIELFVVDKTLRPKLVGGPTRLPFLPTLFGLIGGVKTNGNGRPVCRTGSHGTPGRHLTRMAPHHRQ